MIKFVFAVILCVSILARESHSSDCKDNWKLVFKGFSGNRQNIWNAFSRSQSNNCQVRHGCLPPNVKSGFLRHQRKHLTSPLIQQWNSLKIEKVKMELFKKGRVVVRLIFGAHGSYYYTWFQQNRLLSSSFKDLYTGHCLRYFANTHYQFRWFIGQDSDCRHNYDPRNYFWMAIVEYNDVSSKCKWAKQSAYPVFLYAQRKEKSRFNQNEFNHADELAIYISSRMKSG